MSDPFHGLLVGAHFRGAEIKGLVATFPVGQEGLTLEREPDNAYDPNAIKVIWSDVHVGYVDANCAAWLAQQMDVGHPIESVSVISIERDARDNPKPMLEIVVADTIDPSLVVTRRSPNFPDNAGLAQVRNQSWGGGDYDYYGDGTD